MDEKNNLLNKIKKYIPKVSLIKDFIHHNPLEFILEQEFFSACNKVSNIYGYKTYLKLNEYRELYKNGWILHRTLEKFLNKHPSISWDDLLINEFPIYYDSKVGKFRKNWETRYRINLEKHIHPILFRLVGSFLDQGVSELKSPGFNLDFYSFVLELEKYSLIPIIRTQLGKQFLNDKRKDIELILNKLVGKPEYYEIYLLDQQLEHPGWSGLIKYLDEHPEYLFDKREIHFEDFIYLELVMELDLLERRLKGKWEPLGNWAKPSNFPYLNSRLNFEKWQQILQIWQEAYEWSYYDKVLVSLKNHDSDKIKQKLNPKYQCIFCIDDRESSIRRYLESLDPNIETFGTPGFFQMDIYFHPYKGKFLTKCCPQPIHPSCQISEIPTEENISNWKSKLKYKLFGFLKVSPFDFMMQNSQLIYEKDSNIPIDMEEVIDFQGVKLGYDHQEMASRLENLFKTIGLVNSFAKIVYFIGHGSSSKNNTYYAGYDCGACSGRPGSVNARLAAIIANKKEVRELLRKKGIDIPADTIFIGGIRDTSTDLVKFYIDYPLNSESLILHKELERTFTIASQKNAIERANKFTGISLRNLNPEKVHNKVIKRATKLMIPVPEWNHASNALCIIGRRDINKNLYLARRAFLNSYDYQLDPDGKILYSILKAVIPVTAGINLEYYFSRMDNNRMGAGSKLSHNVIGLLGVANGADGDLRIGLPYQMIRIHEPIRLLMIIEQDPNVIYNVLINDETLLKWVQNHWIHLVSFHPISKEYYLFFSGNKPYSKYTPDYTKIKILKNETELFDLFKNDREVAIINKL